MNKTNRDIFEGSGKKNTFGNNVESNFFIENLDSQVAFPADLQSQNYVESVRRLNDYDFNLLKEDAYKDVADDLFKLEYKIARVEEELKTIESQIQAAKDIGDFELSGELSGRKIILYEDYEALVAMYKEKSFSAKVSNAFGERLKSGVRGLKEKLTDVSEVVLSKLPKRFSSILELKKSLQKLENINRSVDELISLKIPYGENLDKYEQLSKYIIKANSIQNDISRYIK